MSKSSETIHIAGAGVGGLAAATALQSQGVPVVVYDRAERLDDALADDLARLAIGTVRLTEEVVGFEQRDTDVVVRFADGGSDTGALLVGADGLRSTIRAAMAHCREHARVTLLGDAAHPARQGASEALADARVLGAAVNAYGPGPAAVAVYERLRLRR